MTARVAFLVTHLMGSGHLVRTLALARALAARGGEPLVISGGRPLGHVDAAGVRLHQLSPLSSDGLNYRRLLTASDAEATPADLAARRAEIVDILHGERPDALVTELWPFGRRILSDEFSAAVDAAEALSAPWFVSVRDLPEPPKKPSRVAEIRARLARASGVFVHGDPAVAPFETAFPGGESLGAGGKIPLQYTGYVADPPPPPLPAAAGEVLVAVGGGAIGRALLTLAARAAALSEHPWRLRVGGAEAAETAARLRSLGPVVVEPAAPDYRARLGAAAVSVSLAGYNSAVEVALAGLPALLVPMEEAGEQEQLLRAGAFAKLPGLETARLADLTPQRLADTVARLARQPRRPDRLRAEGAAETARLLLAAVSRPPRPAP